VTSFYHLTRGASHHLAPPSPMVFSSDTRIRIAAYKAFFTDLFLFDPLTAPIIKIWKWALRVDFPKITQLVDDQARI
jgi:hypothetical protein